MVDLGKALPETTLGLPLALSGGTAATLAAYHGRWLALYFYPRDSTPGCTTEGLDFNALLPEFARRGADVLGVSRDSLASHDRFRAKQGFGFALASDRDE
ncbi:MAG TPA: peroxiredoxin, partial [Luteimonas sp.]|nr:peroxiredoxin [Luteimonas sp.]